jgi:hypothetical protein
MGHKVHPTGIRLGISKDWNSKWYAGKKHFAEYLAADLLVRQMLRKKLAQAGISKISIERNSDSARVTIHTARPGVVIGKRGEDIEKLRKEVTAKMGVPAHINVTEVRKPELDAQLVAESIAQQLERRIMFRRAMKRFSVGPSSTMMLVTLSSSTSAPWLFSALAIADSTTLRIMCAAFLSENFSRLTARSAERPRTWSATSRAFCGEIRALRRMAFASIVISLLLAFGLLVAAVTLEGPRQREFTELVADHVLVDQHRDVVLAVVHGDRVTDHFRQDHRTTRPGLDRLLVADRGLHLLLQMVVDERAFLE